MKRRFRIQPKEHLLVELHLLDRQMIRNSAKEKGTEEEEEEEEEEGKSRKRKRMVTDDRFYRE